MSLMEKMLGILKELEAPKGKFRLVLLDKWSGQLGNHVIVGDFNSLEEVKERVARFKLSQGEELVIYDERGYVVNDERDESNETR